jgi:hypothetical protein
MNSSNCLFACAIAVGVHIPGRSMPQRSRHVCVPYATLIGIFAATASISCTPMPASVAFTLHVAISSRTGLKVGGVHIHRGGQVLDECWRHIQATGVLGAKRGYKLGGLVAHGHQLTNDCLFGSRPTVQFRFC